MQISSSDRRHYSRASRFAGATSVAPLASRLQATHVRIRDHPPRGRSVVSAHGLSVADARLVGRIRLLQHVGILRGHRPHRPARRDGHAVLRRHRRHARGLRRQPRGRRPLWRQMAPPRHGADDSADGQGRARRRLRASPCRRPITIRSTSRASSTRSTMSRAGASPGTP